VWQLWEQPELNPVSGDIGLAKGIKLGYFAQHQLEFLRADESPIQHLARIAPQELEQKLRDYLGGFGFRGDKVSENTERFSGGEKARLVLALIVWQRPNLLLLDEPTNHLDLDMRQALTEALIEFEGALVVVSHDRHLIRSTTDDLYLVHDGKVEPFDGDLEDYQQWLSDVQKQENQPDDTVKENSNSAQSRKDQKRRDAELRTQTLTEWAQRLGIDLNQPRVVAVIEVDSGQLGVDSAMVELQQLQNALATPERNNLVAIVSLTEMVVLKPALNQFGRWDAEDHRRRVEQLIARMKENGQLRFRVALGNYFTGPGSIARSWRTARTTMMVGKQRMPESRSYFYQDLMLPVLLDSLRGGWQANELARPLARLKAMDNNGLLRRTLQAWFRHNVQPLATSKALFIHRNTLEYRLNRISELTGLDLGNFDDRLLLYVALQLDEQR
jgi:ABC-type multidrug transport system ATPase subunit